MIRRPPRSTLSSSSAASDVYKRQGINAEYGGTHVTHMQPFKPSSGVVILALAVAHATSSPAPPLESGGFLECKACELAADVVRPVVNPLKPVIVDVAVPICKKVNATHQCNPASAGGEWACDDLCKGMMATEMNVIADLLHQYPSRGVCDALTACTPPSQPGPSGSAGVRSNLSDTSGEKVWPVWPSHGGKPSGSFVHFTDLHLQLDYEEGTNTDCGQPICCRKEAGPGAAGKQAQKFGDWACDLAPATLDSMFDAISTLNPPPDFVLNTGDDPAHDDWAQTKTSNLASIGYVASGLLNTSIGKSRPVVSAFGNHAPVPVNQFQGPGLDDWLYQGAATAWGPWLSDDARRTLEFGGFYQMRVADKLRAVVMHSTMFASGESGNWFFAANRTDMAEQFPWLRDTLLQARARGEKVLLLRHCPIGDFSAPFDAYMRNVTDEFSDVIVASFAGHAHTSWVTVLNDQATETEPVDVTYVSGSGTPGGGNPTFRVFHYDLETFEILDFDQYWVDMDQANRDGEAVWTKGYSAKEYFGIPDLTGKSWEALARTWLAGTDQTESWIHYATAMTRGRTPASKQNRVGEACRILSDTNDLYQKCKKDSSANLATKTQPGSGLSVQLGQELLKAGAAKAKA
eukprot:TRINITY_DN20090_c0_g1_i12.p1 TRINITY_DN20090_c0_g1~~TRINITY_DN20090_c0_g1_i12.p1  ORF type:complete len:632 (+),score=132.60 TRINITY_DN20090_c0_g1_i12:135-2030(+)